MQQRPEIPRTDNSVGFHLVLAAIGGHACLSWPFTRCQFGVEAYRYNGPAALVVMFAYGTYANCLEGMFWLGGLWLMLVIRHRIASLAGEERDWDVHSRCSGFPWLAWRLCGNRLNSVFFAEMVVEPVIIAGAGYLVGLLSEPLGMFIASSAVSQMFLLRLERSLDNARVRVIRDKQQEMRAMMERLRRR